MMDSEEGGCEGNDESGDEGGDEDDDEGCDECDIKMFKGFCFLTDGWMNE